MAKNKMTKDEAVLMIVKSTYLGHGAYVSDSRHIVGEFNAGHRGGPIDLVNDAETVEDGSINWEESDEELDRLVNKVRKLDRKTKLFYVSAGEAESFILFSKKPKEFSGIPDDCRMLDANCMAPIGKITSKDAVLILALDR